MLAHLCLLLLSVLTSKCQAQSRQSAIRESSFVHPGILVAGERLAFIKQQVAAQTEPLNTAYHALLQDPLTNLGRSATPFAIVDCASKSSNPVGCFEEREDALAAYGLTLLWSATGNETYAEKAIEYMNAWSGTLKAHTNSNAPLQAGWAGAVWPRVGEVIRYTYPNWNRTDLAKFAAMLREVYLPEVIQGSSFNGNWELVMMEAAMGISIFLDDVQSYHIAMTRFLDRVPAYIYLNTDGALPKTSPEDHRTSKDSIIKYWNGLSNFSIDGLGQETCRDLNHTGYGLASISHVAETSRIQGRDLFKEDLGLRLRAAYELHTDYDLYPDHVPEWLCGGSLDGELGSSTEVANNAFVTRSGLSLPSLTQFTILRRPAGVDGAHPFFYGWETFSSADNIL